MRVLLISHTCQSATEGQPKADRLARLPGIELCVLVPDRWMHYGRMRYPETPADPPYRYEVGRVRWPWAGPGQFYMHWYPGLRRLLRDFRPDVIDIWEEPWGLVSVQACRLRRSALPSARIITETEQNIDRTLPYPFEPFRRYTLRHADFGVARSTQAFGVLQAKGFARPAEVVPNAVDAELFRPLERAECRRLLGLDGFVVGYVGRLVEEKGLTDMVDALALCSPEAHLLFVGDGPLREQLEQHAITAGVGDRVRFLDAMPSSDLPAVMNAVDALALVSRTTHTWKEQFGRVLIEAQSCATPVIGSDPGAIPEVVGDAGIVVPERDPRALAAAFERLRIDPDLRRHLGEAGRRQVEERYTWQRVAERMRDIYLRVSAATDSPSISPR